MDFRLNTRRFVHGRGTDHEEATIPTFLMVDKTFTRPRSMHPQTQFRIGGAQHQQNVSVASESDKVTTLWAFPNFSDRIVLQIPQFSQAW
jgi:hypothetical protein